MHRGDILDARLPPGLVFLHRAGGAAIQRFQELLDTLRFLRSENGCPWDRAQTLADMTGYLLDEAYELQDAVHEDDLPACTEELGDVLFLVLSCALIL